MPPTDRTPGDYWQGIAARALWAAVIDQAVEDEDLEWIRDDSRRPFGFIWICEALDLDAEYMRDGCLDRLGKGRRSRRTPPRQRNDQS